MQYILLFCMFSFFNSMLSEEQQIIKHGSREWNAKEYASSKGGEVSAAMMFIEESGIDFTNKKILDIGCGIGNITAKIAESAEQAHGIDASQNMIDHAQQTYGNISNLSFEHCFAEDFVSNTLYDYALSMFCLHWIKDKQKVFKCINNSLKINGEFLGTIYTSDSIPFSTIVLQELLKRPDCDFLNNSTISLEDNLTRYVLSDEECKGIIRNAGFDIITYEKKSSIRVFKNREELAKFRRPICMARPLFKDLPEEIREWLFNEYIDLWLSKLNKNEDGHYVNKEAVVTLIHARKITEVDFLGYTSFGSKRIS